MSQIKIAIAGIGNCASNFIQGIEYYRNNPNLQSGLFARRLGEYDVSDIEVVAAFDISDFKVGKDLSEAIFEKPNCTEVIVSVPSTGVIVEKGPVMDGWCSKFESFISISKTESTDVAKRLKEVNAEVLVIMLPTGSHDACYYYAKEALKVGVSVINGIPTLLSHDQEIIDLAKSNKAAVVGDDFKSQIGGAILHHTINDLLKMRGVSIDRSYQINYGGNMDFLNLTTDRGTCKHESKKRGINAGHENNENLSINVSYLENQGDRKTCRIYIEGRNFSDCPVTIECKLTVVDSANSSGILIDAIRSLKISLDKNIYGCLEAPSAYFMKSPFNPLPDEVAFNQIKELAKLK